MKPWLKNSNDPLFNEFYTTRDQCEIIFNEMIPIINEQTHKDKISVCCPCDGEQSEIPKYLFEHTNWSIDYFGDLDVNSKEARERMLNADVIITNPPFKMSEWRPFVEWLITNKKRFFIWGPLISQSSQKTLKLILDHGMIYRPKGHKANVWLYNCPNNKQKAAKTFFYTSYKVPIYDYKYKHVDEVQYYNNLPVYDKLHNIPPNYMDWMYVTATSISYLQPFEIDITKRGVPGKYIRFCIKRRGV